MSIPPFTPSNRLSQSACGYQPYLELLPGLMCNSQSVANMQVIRDLADFFG